MNKFNPLGLSQDGKTITLHRLDLDSMTQFPKYLKPDSTDWIEQNRDLIRVASVIDVETTGLEQERDEIIEVGVRQFQFNRETGEILSIGNFYSAFQDPGFPLSEEIQNLTGITDELVKGQKIHWETLDQCLGRSHLIIAHNASFDRPFIDAKSKVSSEKIWGCSLKQIDWAKKGLSSQKLEALCHSHGFFNDAHRALSDADSLIYLLSLTDQNLQTPYFFELITEARKPSVMVHAKFAPFEVKDALRGRKYRWDPTQKVWSKVISKDLADQETEWLTTEIYQGKFRGQIEEILPKDQFK